MAIRPGNQETLEYRDKYRPGREWLSKVRIVDTTQPLLPPKIRDGVLEAVSNALYENKWLKLKYENADGKRGNYRVMPLGPCPAGTQTLPGLPLSRLRQ